MYIKISRHVYAPEMNRVFLRGREWKRHTVDKYRLSIAEDYGACVRLVRRELSRKQKATHIDVILPSGRQIRMENSAAAVRALKRCGIPLGSIKTGARYDFFNGGVEVLM